METFDLRGVTAILPDQDGNCLYAQGRRVLRLIPHTQGPHKLEIRTAMLVRTMKFVASHDNDYKYVQITSGGNWYQGYDTQDRTPLVYPGTTRINSRGDQLICKWSQYADGPCVYENAKGLRWYARGGLEFCTGRNTRNRQGHTPEMIRLPNDPPHGSVVARVPGTATVLSAGVYTRGAAQGSLFPVTLRVRIFDAAVGRFDGNSDVEAVSYRNSWAHGVPTDAGTILVYATIGDPLWREIKCDLTAGPPPEWYPDLPTAVSVQYPVLRASILKDRAAWVGLDNALYYRTAATNKLRRFRPNGRRKVRGCAFAPDGQTLWAFDSVCVFRVDVDD
jgi:hypothetical protein